MKRLVIAALVVVAVGAIAGSATASSGNQVALKPNSGVIYDSTPAPLPGNMPSVGPEAYQFNSLGNKIQFAPGARTLKSVVVTLSSWACQQGHWYLNNCSTPNGATFKQPVTLSILDASNMSTLVSSTQTFQVPYRPSVSPQCASTDRPGGWYQPSTKSCFNGLATQVRFDFGGNVTLPDTIVYEISYNTTHYGPNPLGEGTSCFVAGNCPYDSLNIGLSAGPTVGTDPDQASVWTNGAAGPLYDATYTTPAVQFNAARLWKV
jgi:hypothetical protein